jgi:hypothetical protein
MGRLRTCAWRLHEEALANDRQLLFRPNRVSFLDSIRTVRQSAVALSESTSPGRQRT